MSLLKRKNQLVLAALLISIGIATSVTAQVTADPTLHLVKVTDPDALCLDGSPAAYYISKDGDPKKLYLQFEGGGWCWGVNSVAETIESCYQRSKTDSGSTKNYPETLSMGGALSTNSANNFKDWTRVFIRYCDGSGHQGTRKNPIPYKGTDLYFRGHNVTVGTLNSLEKNNKIFSQATHVVVGGDSAGGLAVFLWTNYIKDRVKAGKVWALPDSGIFLDTVNVGTGKSDYKAMFKNLMAISNVEIAPPVPECVQKFGHEIENCMFAQNLAPFIKTPMFIIQSLYDSWAIPNVLGVRCIDNGSLMKCTSQQLDKIEEYHRNTTNTIFSMASNTANGFFAPVCSIHVLARNADYYNEQWRIPQGSVNSVSKSVESWLSGNDDSTSFRRIDLGKWPDNKPCAGQTQAGERLRRIEVE